jgi:ribosome-binding protein aMBF1 (putative translation factor)
MMTETANSPMSRSLPEPAVPPVSTRAASAVPFVARTEAAEDPEFREAWDRSVFAREVATRVVRYRAERGLNQAQLARAVGMQQSVIAAWSVASGRLPWPRWPGSPRERGIALHLDVSNGAVAVTG